MPDGTGKPGTRTDPSVRVGAEPTVYRTGMGEGQGAGKLAPRPAPGDSFPVRRRLLALCIACIAVVLAPAGAHARRDQTFRYPFARVWEAAVRLMRVDLESPIGEKNRDDGYFLFDFPHNGKTTPGSIEVVRASDAEVRVVVQVPAMPTYVEQMILDKLAKKLIAEYGDPRPLPAPASDVGSKAPAKDTGTDTKKSDTPKSTGSAPK